MDTDPNICELDGSDAWDLPEVDFGNIFLPEYFIKVDRFFHAPGPLVLPSVVFGGRWRFVDEGPAAVADLDGQRLFRIWR